MKCFYVICERVQPDDVPQHPRYAVRNEIHGCHEEEYHADGTQYILYVAGIYGKRREQKGVSGGEQGHQQQYSRKQQQRDPIQGISRHRDYDQYDRITHHHHDEVAYDMCQDEDLPREVHLLHHAGITDYGSGPPGQIGHHEVEREYPCGDVYPEVRYGGGPHLGEDHIVDDQHDDGHDEVPAESQDGVPVASEQVLGYQGPEDVPRFIDLVEILPETVPPFDRNDAAVAVCHYGSSSSRGS